MRIEREKIVAALAAIVFALGLFQALRGFLSPGPDIQIPDVSLPEAAREVGKPRFRPVRRTGIARGPPIAHVTLIGRASALAITSTTSPTNTGDTRRPSGAAIVIGSRRFNVEAKRASIASGGRGNDLSPRDSRRN